MIRAIARESSDLLIFVQYTGGMGYTLDGIGYSPDVNAMLDGIWFDYESAFEDGNISFGYFSPNTGMGQTSAPGNEAIGLSYDAIAAAAETHVIEHPLNAHAYGYPAYDYDHWKLDKTRIADAFVADRSYWRSGWYWGYWSFWIGSRGDDMEDLSYSGMGMSSVQIYDGQISGWKYQPLGGKPSSPERILTGRREHRHVGATLLMSMCLSLLSPRIWLRIPIAARTMSTSIHSAVSRSARSMPRPTCAHSTWLPVSISYEKETNHRNC